MIGKLHQIMMKLLQIRWKYFKFMNIILQSLKNIIRTLNDLIQTFELIPSNSKMVFIIVWFNFFKIYFQNTKKKKQRAGGEPWTPCATIWYSTPVPIWILKEGRRNKRILLETGKLLKNIHQSVMKIQHLMSLKINH